jgi:hypothetical protein
MIAIQAIVVAVAIALLIFGLTGRRTHTARAWKKIGLVLLVTVMIVAVLFPDSTNELANLVGVGRGADLLLYILTLAFITYVVNNYLHQQNDKDALYRLARKVALLEADERYKNKKS